MSSDPTTPPSDLKYPSPGWVLRCPTAWKSAPIDRADAWQGGGWRRGERDKDGGREGEEERGREGERKREEFRQSQGGRGRGKGRGKRGGNASFEMIRQAAPR
eukprot:768723-Hanusia_phi.AAC.4